MKLTEKNKDRMVKVITYIMFMELIIAAIELIIGATIHASLSIIMAFCMLITLFLIKIDRRLDKL